MKGQIQGAHIAKNNYELQVVGLPSLLFVTVDGLEEELEKIKLPDRTMASGGNTNAVEFDAAIPAHHDAEVTAMENWYREGKDPVSPTYKKVASLIQRDIEGNIRRTYQLAGTFPFKRTTDDLEMENEGEMAIITWSFSVDDIVPTQ